MSLLSVQAINGEIYKIEKEIEKLEERKNNTIPEHWTPWAQSELATLKRVHKRLTKAQKL